MAPFGEAYSIDRVLTTGSNVHEVNRRDKLTNHTPFETSVSTSSGSIIVKDIDNKKFNLGTVEHNGQRKNHAIEHHRGLYAPSAMKNSETLPHTAEERMWLEDHRKGEFDFPKSEGMSIRKREDYMRGRELLHATMMSEQQENETTTRDSNPPYTPEEKQWLKDNFRGEFHFLTFYGLKIFNEEDRAEGRLIVRGYMERDGDDGVGALDYAADTEVDTNGMGLQRNMAESVDNDEDIYENYYKGFYENYDEDSSENHCEAFYENYCEDFYEDDYQDGYADDYEDGMDDMGQY